mmetsp:Transcript_19208/g.32733  ORF Transcript_19208/g.32733 Transcript_19208/m.32733 type:complete len:557 (+) Transcript_19208:3-1673(+)
MQQTLSNTQPSARPFIAQINENIPELQIHGLKQLNKMIDYAWHEIDINSILNKIEELAEDPKFPERTLAASVASKVYYHLEQYEISLKLALESREKFDLNERSQYVETLINQCIEKYKKMKQAAFEANRKKKLLGENAQAEEEVEKIDEKMEIVIDKMFQRCFNDKQYKQAIGVALEARRLDKVKEAIELSGEHMEDNLGYTFQMAQVTLKSNDFRTEVMKLLLMIYQNRSDSGKFDYYKIAKCQFHLQYPDETAQLLEKLVQEPESESYLDAYQIAFDIHDKENQSFLKQLSESLEAKVKSHQEEDNKVVVERLNQIIVILSGEIRDRLYLQFLKKNNHTDVHIIQNIKKAVGNKSSVLISATVWSNAMMNAYTTNDTFLVDNLPWVGNLTNWNRFSATAQMGIIHAGNKNDAMKILGPYFTGSLAPEQPNSPYMTAGAYFAYGLIHQNQNSAEVTKYFLDGYRNSGQNESVQHGVSLGLGLVSMATKDQEIFDELKQVLYNNADSAIIGEAAAYGMGLVMIGANDQESMHEMLKHIEDQNHEKIIRALSMALAL